QGGGERQHHGGGQEQRRHQRPQQQRENDEHHGQDERDNNVAVVRGRPLHVQVDRGIAAHLGVSTGDGVHRGPDPVDGGVGGLAVGRGGQRSSQGGGARPGRRWRHTGDSMGTGEGGPQGGRRAWVADDDDGLAQLPA